MSPASLCRSFLAALLLLFIAIPADAGKRRAVKHPEPAPLVNGSIEGIVIDSVTRAPVIYASVTAGSQTFQTNTQGEFEFKSASGYGGIPLRVERSGYRTWSTTLDAGDHVLTIEVEPTATVAVSMTNGTTYQIDLDSALFGFFSGFTFQLHESPEFCLGNGTRANYHRSQMARITGPAVTSQSPSCCDANLQSVSLQLKGQAPATVFFADGCHGATSYIFRGRDHTAGVFRDLKFSDISEIVFP